MTHCPGRSAVGRSAASLCNPGCTSRAYARRGGCAALSCGPAGPVSAGRRVAHGAPGVPGDLEDHERDREADQRVGDLDAEPDDERAGNDAEADQGIDASMIAVGDERRAPQPPPRPEPDAGRDLVADVTDEPGAG